MVAFTNGGAYTSAGQQSTTANIVNTIAANGIKYCIATNKLYSFTNPTTQTLLKTFTKTSPVRPVLNFYGDLIFGDGTSLIRYNKDGTFYEEATGGASDPILKGLDGTVRAITQIGPNIYVWCDNGSNTNIYIWDGKTGGSTLILQKIQVPDKAVKNVALLGNMHYWWSSKAQSSIKEILIGESYQPQQFVKSGYPKTTIEVNPDNEKNRMAIHLDSYNYFNAIETISDIVYLP